MLRTSLLLFCLAPALLADPHKGVMLRENGFLTDGEYLTSANNRFYVIIEDGGNIVVHMGSEPHNDKGRMFSTNLGKGTGRHFMLVQPDGNLVIYRGTGPDHNGGHRWNIGHTGLGGRFFAIMQDDEPWDTFRGWRGELSLQKARREDSAQSVCGNPLGIGNDPIPEGRGW